MNQQEDRFHPLDAVRALALLLGIVLHGTMSFMPALTASGWPIADRSQSELLQGTFFVIHIFRMTMFFVIAGFFAHLLYHRSGAAAFIKNRSRRVLVPLLIGWEILFPATLAVFAWAVAGNGVPAPAPLRQPGAFPLMHLWFLYLLCLLYASMLPVRWLVVRLAPNGLRAHVDALVARLTAQPLASVPLAAPVALFLYFRENWIAFDGIPTPDMSLVPNLPAFIGYATAFCFGWLLQRQTAPLANLSRTRWAHFGISIALTFVAFTLITNPTNATEGDGRIAFVAVYAIASWSWTLAIIGAAAQFMSTDRPAIRYLADSSYWMYLVHLPIVFALQEAMSDWPLHWAVKFPLLLAIALTLLLTSYHWFVRFTFIGNALNGKRQTRHKNAAPATLIAARAPDAG
jgi:glucans biosynthesis protein C